MTERGQNIYRGDQVPQQGIYDSRTPQVDHVLTSSLDAQRRLMALLHDQWNEAWIYLSPVYDYHHDTEFNESRQEYQSVFSYFNHINPDALDFLGIYLEHQVRTHQMQRDDVLAICKRSGFSGNLLSFIKQIEQEKAKRIQS